MLHKCQFDFSDQKTLQKNVAGFGASDEISGEQVSSGGSRVR